MSKDLLTMAVVSVLAYFDSRADIHPCNPNAPNEEMRLWEELNHAHSASIKERGALAKGLKHTLDRVGHSIRDLPCDECDAARTALAELEGK